VAPHSIAWYCRRGPAAAARARSAASSWQPQCRLLQHGGSHTPLPVSLVHTCAVRTSALTAPLWCADARQSILQCCQSRRYPSNVDTSSGVPVQGHADTRPGLRPTSLVTDEAFCTCAAIRALMACPCGAGGLPGRQRRRHADAAAGRGRRRLAGGRGALRAAPQHDGPCVGPWRTHAPCWEKRMVIHEGRALRCLHAGLECCCCMHKTSRVCPETECW